MSTPLPDERFEKLAELVGEALAKRWLQVLNRRQKNSPPANDVAPKPSGAGPDGRDDANK